MKFLFIVFHFRKIFNSYCVFAILFIYNPKSDESLKVKDLPDKKSHEISKMANIVADICETTGTKNVIDVGAGKGYLSTFLSAEYGLNVTAIDCVKHNLTQIANRAKSMSKFYHHRVKQEDGSSEKCKIEVNCLADVVRPDFLPGVTAGEKYILIGLHCCGDLSSVLCETSISMQEIVGLVLVPCCYHHLTEKCDFDEEKLPNVTNQFETGLARGLETEYLKSSAEKVSEDIFIGFPLSRLLTDNRAKIGRNARMLACHSRKRVESAYHKNRDIRSSRAVYYRALLKILMSENFPTAVDVDGRDLRVGKIFAKIEKAENPFVAYCRKAFDKFKLVDHRKILSDEFLTMFEKKMSEDFKFERLKEYEALREVFAGPAESLIVLDKLLFHIESRKWKNIELVKIFDPVKSPRAFAYVCHK